MMIDFEIKNVYDKEAFELYSKKRDMKFRYVKYSGKNYQYLCDYIHEISPDTDIWDEKRLKKGEYYTFSGRYRQELKEIPLWELRCCIANNPYVVIDGNAIPLALTQEEAVAYLTSSLYNRVTCYDNITTDYILGCDGYLVINKDHPRGLSCIELDKHDEWYIIADDRLHSQGNTCTPVYEHETHTVHLEYDLRNKADRIMRLMHDINKMSYLQKKSVVFNPSWEDFIRYLQLFEKCLSENSFKEFLRALYNFIYEETKGGKLNKTRALLPNDFKYCRFVQQVGVCRDYFFAHGVPEYITDKDFTIADVFLEYINTNLPPSNPVEFEKMQLGLLNAFKAFLEELKSHFASTRTIRGYIESDNRGNVFMQDVLLPRELIDYTGFECEISKVVPNNLTPLNYTYEFYCQFPNYIRKKTVGKITIDADNNIVCNQIWLDESFRLLIGMKIQIEKLMLTTQAIRNKGFLMAVKEGKVFDSPSIGCLSIKDGMLEGLIEQDSNGNYHCGDVLIPWSLGRNYIGKQVKLKELRSNTNIQAPYKYFCGDVVTVNGKS